MNKNKKQISISSLSSCLSNEKVSILKLKNEELLKMKAERSILQACNSASEALIHGAKYENILERIKQAMNEWVCDSIMES